MCISGIFLGGAKGTFHPLKSFCPLKLGLNDELALKSAAALNSQLKYCPLYIFENFHLLPLTSFSRKSFCISLELCHQHNSECF